jgi:hypothetical protein
MLPRTDGPRETYVCRTRKQTGGADACAMPVLRRAAVEEPTLRLFETWALDVDGTRERIAEQLHSRIAETRAQADRAAREVANARAALDRFDRDYAAGELSAGSYEHLTVKSREELAAAEAEHDRLTAQSDSVAAALAGLDAEHETLRRLAELRAAVSERVGAAVTASSDAGGIGALRAALGAVFAAVYVTPEDQLTDVSADLPPGPRASRDLHAQIDPVAYPRLYVVPSLRTDMVDDPVGLAHGTLLQRVVVAFGMDPEETADKLTGSGVPL